MKNCDPNVKTIYSPGSPDIKAFTVSKAARVTVFGLNVKDTVTFQRIRFCSKNARFERSGCCVFTPDAAEISSAIEYKIGTCAPMLSPDRNTIIIPYAGTYIPVISAASSPELTIEVEEISGTDFSDKEVGIEPCGFCLDEVWNTTGTERCNQHFVEQEEISNCKNLRWTRTAKRCGYYASVPIVVHLDCDGCGDTQIAYMFHPDETRDPDASVEVKDCEDKTLGYIYPIAGDGHTVPVEECENNIIAGYAINNSPTAPQLYKCDDCNC